MTSLFDSFTLNQISMLRNKAFSGKAENNAELSEGIYLSWDDEGSDVSVSARSEIGRLLVLEAAVKGNPRWFSLNFSLGGGVISAGDVLVIAAEGYARGGLAVPFFLRSAQGEWTEDTHASKPLVIPSQNSIATALHVVGAAQPMLGAEAFHTLIFNLPKSSFGISLRDLRMFVIPAARFQELTAEASVPVA